MGLIKAGVDKLARIAQTRSFSNGVYVDHIIHENVLYILVWNSGTNATRINRYDVSTPTIPAIGTAVDVTGVAGFDGPAGIERIDDKLYVLADGSLSYLTITSPTVLTFGATYADSNLEYRLTQSSGGNLTTDGTYLYATLNWEAIFTNVVKIDVSSIGSGITIVDVWEPDTSTDLLELVSRPGIVKDDYLFFFCRKNPGPAHTWKVYSVHLPTFSSASVPNIYTVSPLGDSGASSVWHWDEQDDVIYMGRDAYSLAAANGIIHRFTISSPGIIGGHDSFTIEATTVEHGLNVHNSWGHFARRVSATILRYRIYKDAAFTLEYTVDLTTTNIPGNVEFLDKNAGFTVVLCTNGIMSIIPTGSY